MLHALLLLQNPAPELKRLPPYAANARGDEFTIAPPYARAPEATPRDGVPKGRVERFTMDSKESAIYPGIAKDRPGQVVPYSRRVTLYVPAGYRASAPLPFLVSQDSIGAGILPTILDNMIADRRLPAMAAILIDSGGGDAQGSERGLEYDTVSGRYAEFVETEVLPRIARDYGVAFTKDPEGRLAMGGSSGGAAAFSMAWWHPDLYRRVLTYSGTYVNQQSPFDPATPHGAWEYHENLVPRARRKPLRIWMEVSENDLRANDPESTFHNWPLANARMAAVLRAKRYPYRFVYAQDAGHTDGRVLAATLPDALAWVWQGYRAKR